MDFKTYFMGMSKDEREQFAIACYTSRQHMTNIAYSQKTCGEKLAIAIDRKSLGAVRCEDLRPDVDWAYLRGSVAVDAEKTAKTDSLEKAA